jgi:hypothetical protein
MFVNARLSGLVLMQKVFCVKENGISCLPRPSSCWLGMEQVFLHISRQLHFGCPGLGMKTERAFQAFMPSTGQTNDLMFGLME